MHTKHAQNPVRSYVSELTLYILGWDHPCKVVRVTESLPH